MSDREFGGRNAGIAHELNNLLAAIQGNADLMRGDFGGVESIREGLDEIDNAVTRARDLVRKLLLDVPSATDMDAGREAKSLPQPRRLPNESRGQTVLIADDEEPVRRVASRLLARNGYDVLEASNGAEALRMLVAGDGEIDLLISDIIMPEMGGLELARRVGIEFPGLPMLLISGYTDTHESGQTLPANTDLLQKPFSGTELTAAVARCLARGKQRPGS